MEPITVIIEKSIIFATIVSCWAIILKLKTMLLGPKPYTQHPKPQEEILSATARPVPHVGR